MHIEDIITKLVGWGFWSHNCDQFIRGQDFNLLASLGQQISQQSGLTEKQCFLSVNTLKRYERKISVLFNKDISGFLDKPSFRFPIRKLNPEKSIKISKINNQKIIEVRFPYDEAKINVIKAYKKEIYEKRFYNFGMGETTIEWNHENKTWNFLLIEEHVSWLVKTFPNFDIDEEILAFSKEIDLIFEKIENYVPMLVYNDGVFSFKNTHKNIPQPTSSNLLEVLFMAKKYGINIWDEAIDIAINSNEINAVTAKILKNNSGDPVVLSGGQSKFENLDEIISYSQKVLFVIPGGTEMQHLQAVHRYLKSQKIDEKFMTVMFRLDSSSGKICNDYIHRNNLNTPLSDDIKFFFVSGKIPKPLIGLEVNFDTVVQFGSNSAHFTLRNFVQNHHNVINMTIPKETIFA